MPFPTLETARCRLRVADAADVPAILRYFRENETHLQPFEPRRPSGFLTEAFWQDRLMLARMEFDEDRSLRLFLFDRDKPTTVIGTVNYTNFVRGVFQACNLGYSVDHRYQGRGYMTEALQAANSYVFDELQFHRIMANYMPRNHRSGALLKRLGFVVEGIARDYIRINGRWEDHVLTSRLNPAWESE